jgi:hypothetical protein
MSNFDAPNPRETFMEQQKVPGWLTATKTHPKSFDDNGLCNYEIIASGAGGLGAFRIGSKNSEDGEGEATKVTETLMDS